MDPLRNHAADDVCHCTLNLWQEEQKSRLRQYNTFVHTLLTTWLMMFVSHLHCAPPPGPNSVGIINWAVFREDRQWWMAVAVRAIYIGLIVSIHHLTFIHICCMTYKYIQCKRSTISLSGNQKLHFWIDFPDNDEIKNQTLNLPHDWLWGMWTYSKRKVRQPMSGFP